MRRLFGLAVAIVVLAPVSGMGSAAPLETDGLIAFAESGRANPDTVTIKTVRPDGTHVREIGRGWGPKWMPDGRRLLFSTVYRRAHGLFTTTAAGRDLRWVDCYGCRRQASADFYEWEPSPDADRLVVLGLSGAVIQIVDITTGLDGDTVLDPARDLVEDCGAGCESVFNPTWSPDGTRIAYIDGTAGSGGRICIVRAAGGEPRCITPAGSDSRPDWSPDGRWIVFDRPCRRKCQLAIYMIRPNGTGLRQVRPHASDPSWSPDGSRIAFVRLGRPGTCEGFPCRLGISTIRWDGSDPRIVTRNPRHDAPEWQPR